jgi:hypothetical protein
MKLSWTKRTGPAVDRNEVSVFWIREDPERSWSPAGHPLVFRVRVRVPYLELNFFIGK